MMATENPLHFPDYNHNNYQSELGESKKVKLMYTSEFLKSFDRGPKTAPFLPEDHQVHSSTIDKLREKLDAKDEQIHHLRQILVKLKDIVNDRKDDDLVKRMTEAFNSNEEGRQMLATPVAYKIPPLRIPDDGPTTSPPHQLQKSPRRKVDVSPTSSLSPPVTPTASASLPSPTSIPISAPILTPPSTPQSKQTQKSPRRTPSSTKLNLTISPSSSMSNLPVTLLAPSSSNASASRAMKKSPSMPVINNPNNLSEKQKQDVQSQLKLKQKTKSTEDVFAGFGEKKKLSLEETKKFNKSQEFKSQDNKNPEVVSPRKTIKKSVSMSAICADNDKSAALKCTSLEEIVGQIYPLTKYQAGCRFLQKKLEEQPDPQHVTIVFNEVFDHLIELMTDPYGQYLVPKLMKHCDKNQRQAIVVKIAPKIVTFACHTYGIHGVQKILEFLTDDQVGLFMDAIKPSVIQLAKDNKGNYLIQSFLKQFPPERNQYIFDSIISHIVDVSTHKVGCTLVNRCLDYANDSQIQTIVSAIASQALELVQDQFGNYVVQHILATKPVFAPKIINGLLGHIPELSVQKFSSNVIEKCLQVSVSSSPDLYNAIIKEITDADLLALLQDRYANFVIQTALDVADDTQHARLVKLILPYIHQIKTPYVMHIQKKILQV